MKEIKEFPGYFITKDGRVFSAWKQERQKGIQGIITYLDYDNLKEKTQYTNRDGYRVVSFYINGKQHTKKIHRLVAEAFIENPDNLPHVNHIDEIKSNNNLNNLEWVTPHQNSIHSNCRWVWTIINLNTNETIEVINLREFCRDNDLDRSAMLRTLKKKVSRHKNHKIIAKTQFK
jgi:hypothetical protein